MPAELFPSLFCFSIKRCFKFTFFILEESMPAVYHYL